MMFARLRAKYGFSGEVSHSAMTARRSLPATSGTAPPRNVGGTGLPMTGWFTSPPPLLNTIVSRGSSPGFRPTWLKNDAQP
jgi:hypothetical protein